MEIGGYFELELRRGQEYHPYAIKLNTGISAFKYILKARGYKKVYLPYYTCASMLNSIRSMELGFEFYHINDRFEPLFDFTGIKKDEVFVYTNYFGLLDNVVLKLAGQCQNLIIDNAQSFYSKPIPDIDTFYSARKFFGVPDGAYLYTNCKTVNDLPTDLSWDRFAHLLNRIDNGPDIGYQDFKDNNKKLGDLPILGMSKLTQALLRNIDYAEIRKKRRANFLRLEKDLSKFNKIKLPIDEHMVPMVYPFLTNHTELRQKLIADRIYVATYWPNVYEWVESKTVEFKFTGNLVPLPVDQRIEQRSLGYMIRKVLDICL